MHNVMIPDMGGKLGSGGSHLDCPHSCCQPNQKSPVMQAVEAVHPDLQVRSNYIFCKVNGSELPHSRPNHPQ